MPTVPVSPSAQPLASQWADRDVQAVPDNLLNSMEREQAQRELPQWTLDGGHLVREFRFADFHHTMAFVNAVAWIAHRADHHPDMHVGYNRCSVRWSTHSAGGLTLKDLICAAQVDALQCLKA